VQVPRLAVAFRVVQVDDTDAFLVGGGGTGEVGEDGLEEGGCPVDLGGGRVATRGFWEARVAQGAVTALVIGVLCGGERDIHVRVVGLFGREASHGSALLLSQQAGSLDKRDEEGSDEGDEAGRMDLDSADEAKRGERRQGRERIARTEREQRWRGGVQLQCVCAGMKKQGRKERKRKRKRNTGNTGSAAPHPLKARARQRPR